MLAIRYSDLRQQREDIKKLACQLYDEGFTANQIMQKTGISNKELYRGLAHSPEGFTQKRKSQHLIKYANRKALIDQHTEVVGF